MNYGKNGVRAKQRALNAKSAKIGRKLVVTCVKLILYAIIGVGVCGVSAGIGAFRGILASAPDAPLDDIMPSGQATIVYDCEGNEIDQYVSANSNRIIVDMDQIPKHLGQAFVAIEDERFYQHNGVDLKGIVRAGYQYIKTGGDSAQGASTITQQLLKNTVFTDWTSEGRNKIKKIKRKIQEQYLALEVTKHFSKDEILLRYMNAINLGQNTLGVESASLRYFGKSCSELTLSECAVIACITQNPTKYNPIRHPEENVKRRKACLDKMLELEFITQAEYDAAIADTDAVYERIGLYDVDFRETSTSSATYFSDAVYAQVRDDLIEAGYSENEALTKLTAGGLRIESTLDPAIQAIADEEFADPDNYPSSVKWYLTYALTITKPNGERENYSKENMMTWFKENVNKDFNLIFSSQDDAYEAIDRYRNAMMAELSIEADDDNYEETISMTPQPQAAIVIEDQTTGYVVAMVGGRGNKEGRLTLNRATSALRSPGSTFKVLSSFAPALDSAGKTLATTYADTPFNYSDGTPVKNWYTGYGRYGNICSIRLAITQSLNIIAVKNLTVITPQLGYDYLQNFGFTTLTDGVYINGEWKTDVIQAQALGGLTYGVSPYELNAAYAAIANQGVYAQPKLYTRVTDSAGNVILDNTTPTTHQVIKATTAFLLTDAMVDVVNSGTGGRVRFNNMAIAGKTGTSSDYKDVWFAGFTPYYTCTTWAGYDNSIGMNSNTEGNVAKTLWKAVMERVHENLPNQAFTVPQGIVRGTVCSKSGKAPIPGLCDGSLTTEYFAEGTIPTETCTVHYQGEYCNYDQVPASPECPFKYIGVRELSPDDPVLKSGSGQIIYNEDGTTSLSDTARCHHNAEFFANPDAQSIIEGERWQMDQAAIAAQQAAEQAQEGAE